MWAHPVDQWRNKNLQVLKKKKKKQKTNKQQKNQGYSHSQSNSRHNNIASLVCSLGRICFWGTELGSESNELPWPLCLASEQVWNIWRLGNWSLSFPEALCLQMNLLPGWRQKPSLHEIRRGYKAKMVKSHARRVDKACLYLDYCFHMDVWKRNTKPKDTKYPIKSASEFPWADIFFFLDDWTNASPLWSDSRIQGNRKQTRRVRWG